jgi:ActR/RegA family two-component response regulator
MNGNQKDRVSMLLVDDVVFCQVLARAFEKRSFIISVAHSVEFALMVLLRKKH